MENWKEKLDKLQRAGIEIGSRFRVERLNSFNDFKVDGIDFGRDKITFSDTTSHPDYQGKFEWPIDRVLENIKLYQGSRWVQIDENRRDIVIPDAKDAIMQRAKDPSPCAAFTDSQVKALDRYCTLFSDKTTKEEIYSDLINMMRDDFKKEHIPDAWVNDMREEAIGLAHGERRQSEQGLKR